MPECYCIEREHMAEEKEAPNSQEFYPVSPSEFGVHLWSNSLYAIALLLREKLIYISDIDPIYRHLPANQRPKSINRHSAFQVSSTRHFLDYWDIGWDNGSKKPTSKF